MAVCRHGRWEDGSRAVLDYFADVDRWNDSPLRAASGCEQTRLGQRSTATRDTADQYTPKRRKAQLSASVHPLRSNYLRYRD